MFFMSCNVLECNSKLHTACWLLFSHSGQTEQFLSRPELQGHLTAPGPEKWEQSGLGGSKLGVMTSLPEAVLRGLTPMCKWTKPVQV